VIETIPGIKDLVRMDGGAGNATSHSKTVDWSSPFFVVEVVCITWFTFEFFIRFVTCPEKTVFMKDFLNIIDVTAIAPFFVNLAFADDDPDKVVEQSECAQCPVRIGV
jgi:hypothetical protein